MASITNELLQGEEKLEVLKKIFMELDREQLILSEQPVIGDFVQVCTRGVKEIQETISYGTLKGYYDKQNTYPILDGIAYVDDNVQYNKVPPIFKEIIGQLNNVGMQYEDIESIYDSFKYHFIDTDLYKELMREKAEAENPKLLANSPLKENIIGLYQNEYPAIRFISEDTAKHIEELNLKNGSPLSIKEIFETYKEIGGMLDNPNVVQEQDIPTADDYKYGFKFESYFPPTEEIMLLENQNSYKTFMNEVARDNGITAKELAKMDIYYEPAMHVHNRLPDWKIDSELERVIRKYEDLVNGLKKTLTDLKQAEKANGPTFWNLLKARLKNLHYITYTRDALQGTYMAYKDMIPEVKNTMKELQRARRELQEKNQINTDNVIKQDFQAFKSVVEDLRHAQIAQMNDAAHQRTVNMVKDQTPEITQ